MVARNVIYRGYLAKPGDDPADVSLLGLSVCLDPVDYIARYAYYIRLGGSDLGKKAGVIFAVLGVVHIRKVDGPEPGKSLGKSFAFYFVLLGHKPVIRVQVHYEEYGGNNKKHGQDMRPFFHARTSPN